MPKVCELKAWLDHYYDPDQTIAYDIWSTDDVFQKAEEMEIELSEEQAEEVLENVHRHADATLGITWDTLEAEIDALS